MNRETFQKVQRWMEEHHSQMTEDIMRLVRIPSVADTSAAEKPFGPACRRVLEEMLKIGEEHGFHTHNYEYYCGSLWIDERAEDPAACVGFWGHLDVVPVGEGWQFEPFKPFVRDGYLVGRGSQDNKGPTIATLYLMQCFHELGIQTRYPLRMFFGCEEEQGMRDLEYYAAHYPCPRLSIIADSGFPVCYGEKGILEANLVSNRPFSGEVLSFSGGVASNMVPPSAELTVRRTKEREETAAVEPALCAECQGEALKLSAQGVSKHSAFPEGGVNAITRLVRGVLAAGILQEEDEEILLFLERALLGWYGRGLGISFEDKISGKLTCVGSMCGVREDGLPFLHVNIRYSITADSDRLVETLRRVCSENGFTLDLIRDSKPNYFPREHPAVDRLTAVYNELTGSHAEPFVMGGGTYARKLPHAFAYGMGIPGDKNEHEMFLPGHGGAHEPDEALKLNSLWKGAELFAAALLELNEIQI